MLQYTILKEKTIRNNMLELARLDNMFYIKVHNERRLVIFARVFPTLKQANKCWRTVYNCINYGKSLEEIE